MKRTLTLIAFAIVSSAVPALAQQSGGPVPPVRVPVDSPEFSKVEMLLSSYHALPAKAQFEEVQGVRTILSSMAEDRTAPRLQKRALEALGYWSDDATLAIYQRVLSNPQTRNGTRHQTMLLAGKVFGVRGLALVKPFLSADDVQLRLTAVDAIAATRSNEGFELLANRASVETNAVVLERIEKMGSRVR